MVVIDLGSFDAFVFDVDGVITRTAAVHARACVPPARAAVFEDATAGIAAGRAGSFGLVIGIGAAEHATALRAHGAHAVVADLAEVYLEDRRPGATVAV
jgi:beta-phosphoglucomutase-like phosphatase (HAD superfamily)